MGSQIWTSEKTYGFLFSFGTSKKVNSWNCKKPKIWKFMRWVGFGYTFEMEFKNSAIYLDSHKTLSFPPIQIQSLRNISFPKGECDSVYPEIESYIRNPSQTFVIILSSLLLLASASTKKNSCLRHTKTKSYQPPVIIPQHTLLYHRKNRETKLTGRSLRAISQRKNQKARQLTILNIGDFRAQGQKKQ